MYGTKTGNKLDPPTQSSVPKQETGGGGNIHNVGIPKTNIMWYQNRKQRGPSYTMHGTKTERKEDSHTLCTPNLAHYQTFFY